MTQFLNYLIEEKDHFFKTKKEIIDWLQTYHITKYTIKPDLTVDLHQSITSHLEGKKIEYLPVKFGIASGEFFINKNPIKSLIGCPDRVEGNFDCVYNDKLISYEGAPKYVGKDVNIWKSGPMRYTNIHKFFPEVNNSFVVSDKTEGDILGFLLIKGLKKLFFFSPEQQKPAKKLSQALEILLNYLPNDKGRGALLDCQSEMLDADLEEFAKL